MKLRQHRRRTLTSMRRQFKQRFLVNRLQRNMRQFFRNRFEQVAAMHEEGVAAARELCGLTEEMRQQPSNNKTGMAVELLSRDRR